MPPAVGLDEARARPRGRARRPRRTGGPGRTARRPGARCWPGCPAPRSIDRATVARCRRRRRRSPAPGVAGRREAAPRCRPGCAKTRSSCARVGASPPAGRRGSSTRLDLGRRAVLDGARDHLAQVDRRRGSVRTRARLQPREVDEVVDQRASRAPTASCSALGAARRRRRARRPRRRSRGRPGAGRARRGAARRSWRRCRAARPRRRPPGALEALALERDVDDRRASGSATIAGSCAAVGVQPARCGPRAVEAHRALAVARRGHRRRTRCARCSRPAPRPTCAPIQSSCELTAPPLQQPPRDRRRPSSPRRARARAPRRLGRAALEVRRRARRSRRAAAQPASARREQRRPTHDHGAIATPVLPVTAIAMTPIRVHRHPLTDRAGPLGRLGRARARAAAHLRRRHPARRAARALILPGRRRCGDAPRRGPRPARRADARRRRRTSTRASTAPSRTPRPRGTVPERDTFELALARRAIERDMPFLGICRGMQVMNVALGGTLLQHLPDASATSEHRRALGLLRRRRPRRPPARRARWPRGRRARAATARSPTTTRASTASATGSRSRAGRRSTSCPRRSRTPSAASRSACSGTPRPTSAAASSPRWSRRPRPPVSADPTATRSAGRCASFFVNGADDGAASRPGRR